MTTVREVLFVGWTGGDEQLARSIVRELERRGVQCWLYGRNNSRFGERGQLEGFDAATRTLLVATAAADTAQWAELAKRAATLERPVRTAIVGDATVPAVAITTTAESASELLDTLVADYAGETRNDKGGTAEATIGHAQLPTGEASAALVIVSGARTDHNGHGGILRSLVEAAQQQGVATIQVGLPWEGQWLDQDTLPAVETAVLIAIARLDDACGRACAVLGVDLGGLVAANVAFDGRVTGLAVWDTDREESRELQPRFDGARVWFGPPGREVEGSPDFGYAFDDYAVTLEHRRCPVPLFSLSALSHPAAAATAAHWAGRDTGVAEIHQVRTRRDLTEVGAGWSPARSIELTLDWLLTVPPIPASERRPDGRLVDPAPKAANYAGKAFISYRQSDGRERADLIQTHLDAAGIPNFLDHHDLTVESIDGVIKRNFVEACEGGVLIVSPEIKKSRYVPRTELPALRRRHESDPDFWLSIDNMVKFRGKVDPDAPDRLLGLKPDSETEGPLKALHHYQLGSADMTDFLKGALDARLRKLRNDTVHIDMQTYNLHRNVTHAPSLRQDTWTRRADLRIRLDENNPEPVFRAFPCISEALNSISPQRIVVTGGGGIPFAYALGGVLVKTKIKCPVVVVDEWGEWGLDMPDPDVHHIEQSDQEGVTLTPGEGAIAVYLDFVRQPNDEFARYLNATGLPVARALRIGRCKGEDRYLLPGETRRLLDDAAEMIRLAATGRQRIHLFAATTFPLSVLMGREFNIYEVHVYQHNNEDADPPDHELYRPCLVLDRKTALVKEPPKP